MDNIVNFKGKNYDLGKMSAEQLNALNKEVKIAKEELLNKIEVAVGIKK